MIADCIAGQRVQLDYTNGPNPSFDLAEVWRANSSVIGFNFPIPSQRCGNITVLLVDSNGNPTDIVNIDCGKLFVSA